MQRLQTTDTLITSPLAMLPVFKDFDKPAADLISEDFGLKYTLKTKNATPYGVVMHLLPVI